LAVDGLNDVARSQPGGGSRRSFGSGGDCDAAQIAVTAELPTDAVVDRNDADAEERFPGSCRACVYRLPRALHESLNRLSNGVGRDREADTLGRRRVCRRLIHADESRVVVDERTAGIPGIDRRGRLEQSSEEVDLLI